MILLDKKAFKGTSKGKLIWYVHVPGVSFEFYPYISFRRLVLNDNIFPINYFLVFLRRQIWV